MVQVDSVIIETLLNSTHAGASSCYLEHTFNLSYPSDHITGALILPRTFKVWDLLSSLRWFARKGSAIEPFIWSGLTMTHPNTMFANPILTTTMYHSPCLKSASNLSLYCGKPRKFGFGWTMRGYNLRGQNWRSVITHALWSEVAS